MALHTFVQFIRLGRYPLLLSGFVPFLGGALFALLRGADFSLAQFLLGYTAMAAAHLCSPLQQRLLRCRCRPVR